MTMGKQVDFRDAGPSQDKKQSRMGKLLKKKIIYWLQGCKQQISPRSADFLKPQDGMQLLISEQM